MTAFTQRMHDIRQAPTGEKIAAFFDYDGTLIDGFSVTALAKDRIRRGDIGLGEFASSVLIGLRGVESELDYAAVLDSLRPWFAGKTYAEMLAVGARVFKEETAALVRPQMWQIIQAHRERGHRIVIASSATRFQIEPIATAIDADIALATDVEVVDGVLTGRILGRPLWGPGKAAAVRALAREHDLDLSQSFAYSDGIEDIPYLESVGRPAAVSPGPVMRAEAQARGWPILELANPQTNQVADLVRTSAFYGSVLTATVAGAAISLLTGDPKPLVERAIPNGTDLALALAGVDVRVVDGAEHLTDARPCVFIFNHQSKLDLPVMIHLVRRDATGVAKKEVRNVPILGAVLDQAGLVFIDRADRATAIKQLEPAITALRDDGISLAIAPEGTRSATPAVGPFKKGAFHIAMQAGVPIVPIVLRNTGSLQWRGAQLISPGTVEVIVLPPIDTSTWVPQDVGRYAAQTRQLYVSTLADWPTDADDE